MKNTRIAFIIKTANGIVDADDLKELNKLLKKGYDFQMYPQQVAETTVAASISTHTSSLLTVLVKEETDVPAA